jgi:hypothetical protein
MRAIRIMLVLVVAIALAIGTRALRRRRLGRPGRDGEAVIVDLRDSTTTDASGAVRSVQGADLLLAPRALEELWSPMNLERLARTYWRFLARVTLGLIRVRYTDRERFVVLLAPPLKLITFQAPEYEMDETRGVVRWRIERGLLVARRGRGGKGHLQIDIERKPSDDPGLARLSVDVEVANFYPAIALGISRRLYNATQSRIHVIVTNGFLRSLARLDLAESRVGRYAEARTMPTVSDPARQGDTIAPDAVAPTGRPA